MCPAFPKDTQFQANSCPTSSDAASLLFEKNFLTNRMKPRRVFFLKSKQTSVTFMCSTWIALLWTQLVCWVIGHLTLGAFMFKWLTYRPKCCFISMENEKWAFGCILTFHNKVFQTLSLHCVNTGFLKGALSWLNIPLSWRLRSKHIFKEQCST